MRLSSLRPAHTLVAVPVLALALGGCGGQDLADSVTERIIESATSEEVDVDFDTEKGQVTVKGEDGDTTYSTGRGLPDDFPTDVIEFVDGEIGMTVGTSTEDGQGWAVTVQPDGSDGQAVHDDAVSRLESQGFSVVEEGSMQATGMWVRQLANDPWAVTIRVLEQEGQVQVQYVVVSGTL